MMSQHHFGSLKVLEDGISPYDETLKQHYSYLHDEQHLLAEANAFFSLLSQEGCTVPNIPERLATIQTEIEQTGTYWHSHEELIYGAKVAWRNNAHCIGRLHWKSLGVRDMRHLSKAEDVFQALVEHLRNATNGGKIRPLITVFAPQILGQSGIRIWNPQLIRYAGYRQHDGSVVGDPLHVELTEAIELLGWKGERTAFDVLPLVIQMPGQAPRLFELPGDAVLEVFLTHPTYSWFAELGLKWHALPVISNMRMEIGGISYAAAPFNGWYMSSEIGARNLSDVNRYNLLPLIAQKMGLDMSTNQSLWKDRALVELNVAVLHSFIAQGINIVDHHTATQQFVRHEQQEQRAGRTTPADWGWMVPPISGSVTPVFHCPYENITRKPNFFYQSNAWSK